MVSPKTLLLSPSVFIPAPALPAAISDLSSNFVREANKHRQCLPVESLHFLLANLFPLLHGVLHIPVPLVIFSESDVYFEDKVPCYEWMKGKERRLCSVRRNTFYQNREGYREEGQQERRNTKERRDSWRGKGSVHFRRSFKTLKYMLTSEQPIHTPLWEEIKLFRSKGTTKPSHFTGYRN